MALIYNWWNWYVRLANPKNRMEAITSRPKLLSAVGRMTSHAGQSKILLTVMHESVDQIKQLVANVRSGIRHISASAPQLIDGLAEVGRNGAIHRGANTGRATQIHADASRVAERLTEESRFKA